MRGGGNKGIKTETGERINSNRKGEDRIKSKEELKKWTDRTRKNKE